MSDVTILYGPTASGKSSIAIDWTLKNQGVIINSDALQIYNALPILTAQPSQKEQQQCPHILYGTHDPLMPLNAHDWVLQAMPFIQSNNNPIIVGGTGLYIKTLLEGLSEIPDIDPQYRQESEDLYQSLGAEKFSDLLAQVDPQIVNTIHANNRQRMVRAYEVYLGTNKPFSYWRDQPKKPILPATMNPTLYLLLPDKELVIGRASTRFDAMIKMGVIDEVKNYHSKYPKGSTADQALGLHSFIHHINGRMSLEEVKSRVLLDTNQYIKRQYTWARGQFKDIDNVHIITSGDDLAQI